jgi:hypothetical protein
MSSLLGFAQVRDIPYSILDNFTNGCDGVCTQRRRRGKGQPRLPWPPHFNGIQHRRENHTETMAAALRSQWIAA